MYNCHRLYGVRACEWKLSRPCSSKTWRAEPWNRHSAVCEPCRFLRPCYCRITCISKTNICHDIRDTTIVDCFACACIYFVYIFLYFLTRCCVRFMFFKNGAIYGWRFSLNGHFKVDRWDVRDVPRRMCVWIDVVEDFALKYLRSSSVEIGTERPWNKCRAAKRLCVFSRLVRVDIGAKRARRTISSTVVCTRVEFERLAENNTASSPALPFPVTLDTARTECSLRMSFVLCSFDSAESNGVLHRFERSIRFRFHPTVPIRYGKITRGRVRPEYVHVS